MIIDKIKPDISWQPTSTYNNDNVQPTSVSDKKTVSPGRRINYTLPLGRSLPRLTGKQRELVDYIIKHPKASKLTAYQAVYDTRTDNLATLYPESSKATSLPQVKQALDDYNNTAKLAVIEVLEYSKELGKSGSTAGASYAGTALQAANSIIDRVDGKATQRVMTESMAVTLNIDLTGVTEVATG